MFESLYPKLFDLVYHAQIMQGGDGTVMVVTDNYRQRAELFYEWLNTGNKCYTFDKRDNSDNVMFHREQGEIIFSDIIIDGFETSPLIKI